MWLRTPRTNRLARHVDMAASGGEGTNGQRNINQDPNDDASDAGGTRALGDVLRPARSTNASCIVLPAGGNSFVIKTNIIGHLPTFHGMESENPYLHIKEFEDVSATIFDGKTSSEIIFLKLFPFSLKDKAKIWLNALPSKSITTWIALQAEFLKKFFPLHRTQGLQRQITSFTQKSGESFDRVWERFKDLLMACPHHGFDDYRLIGFFFDSLNAPTKQFVEMMCNGNFFRKSATQAWEYLEEISENARTWDTSEYDRDMPKTASQSSSRGGRFDLTTDESLEARVQAMVTNQFNSLSLKGTVKSATTEEACTICDKPDHSIAECPTIPLMRDMMNDNMSEASSVFSNQFGGGSQGSNANWRATNTQQNPWRSNQNQGTSSQQGNQYYRHPNSTQSQGGGSFQGRRNEPNTEQQIQPYQPPQDLYAQLLQMQQSQFQQMHAANQAAIAQQQQAFQAFQQQQNQLLNDQFASFAARWEKGKFPSQTTPNPNTPPQFQCQEREFPWMPSRDHFAKWKDV